MSCNGTITACVAVGVAAIALLSAKPADAVESSDRRAIVFELDDSVSFGGQQPPPIYAMPAFEQFVPIYGGYKYMLDDGEDVLKPTFLQWCMKCGITDIKTLKMMLVLHNWAEHVGFDPTLPRR